MDNCVSFDFNLTYVTITNSDILIDKNIYKIYKIFIMVKTLRISDDSIHKDLLKIQGQIQANSGEFTSMEDTLAELIKAYRKKNR